MEITTFSLAGVWGKGKRGRKVHSGIHFRFQDHPWNTIWGRTHTIYCHHFGRMCPLCTTPAQPPGSTTKRACMAALVLPRDQTVLPTQANSSFKLVRIGSAVWPGPFKTLSHLRMIKFQICPVASPEILQLDIDRLLGVKGLTLSLPRVINFKNLLQPHQKYYITQYEELGFS